MSEDEATEKLKQLVARCKECKFATCENCEINWNEVQAIETILDLYKKEKENRRMAEHNYDELTKTTGRLETELEEEKEKNKEIEQELSISIQLICKANSYLENISRKLKLTDENTYGYIYDEIIDKLQELLEE